MKACHFTSTIRTMSTSEKPTIGDKARLPRDERRAIWLIVAPEVFTAAG